MVHLLMFKSIGDISIKPYPADMWVDEAIRLKKSGVRSEDILPLLQWMQSLPIESFDLNE